MVSTKSAAKVEEQSASEAKEQRRKQEAPMVIPRHGLRKTLTIAETIEKDNQGEPYSRLMLAKSLNLSPTGSPLIMLLSSSIRYGLTEGNYQAEKISLTPLGKSIVAPTMDTNVKSELRKALLTPELFQKVYQRLDQHVIPRADILKNTLAADFHVPKRDVDTVLKVITENMNDYGLAQDIKGTKYLQLDMLAPSKVATKEESLTEPESGGAAEEIPLPEVTAPVAPPAVEQVVKVPRVFISHSKNKKILENMKQTLTFGKFDYRVAEEKETLSMPLSDKVFGLMQECNCAIINVSADQEKKQGETYAINENVLIEIGAAFLHYDRRVLLVIDQRLKDRLPTILQGITAIFYEGQELSLSDGMKLMKVLDEFRNKL